MQIVILGSGVIGVTSAYYLAKEGHNITVVDRQSSAGMEVFKYGAQHPWLDYEFRLSKITHRYYQ